MSASYSFTSDVADRHPTSGLRYAAANFASPQLLEWGVQASRVGGDDQTPYNWKTDTANSDNDFFWLTGTPFHPFQQEPQHNQSYVDLMLLNTVEANATLFLLVPAAGWVDAGKIQEGCGSFPIKDYGHQQEEYYDWGNGVYPNGTLLRGDWRCYVPFGLTDVMEWLQHVREVVGGDRFDQHVILQLDNEYDLWGFVHRDIHPDLVTYDELWGFTVTYASAIKAKWPKSRIAGPISYGWCGYWWSEQDGCTNNGTDLKTHNNMYLQPWFLQQLEQYYQATGVQLLDVFDDHYYPDLPSNTTTAADRATYLAQVRTWWDPSYVDQSWIGECGEHCGGPSLMVLPRFHALMKQYAPSLHLELAISEYAFGFDDSDELGALATAESIAVLGLFNVTWGLRWISPAPGSAAEQVWKLWHNWDDQGSKLYGDFASTTSSRADNVSAYSIYDGDAKQLYVLLFSHLEGAISCQRDDSALSVQHASTSATSAVTYELLPGNFNVSAGVTLAVKGSEAGSEASFTVADAACGMPGHSIRMIVVRDVSMSAGAAQKLYVPWEDERYAEVDWTQPLAGVAQGQLERVAAQHATGLNAVRAGKKDLKQRYQQAQQRRQQRQTGQTAVE